MNLSRNTTKRLLAAIMLTIPLVVPTMAFGAGAEAASETTVTMENPVIVLQSNELPLASTAPVTIATEAQTEPETQEQELETMPEQIAEEAETEPTTEAIEVMAPPYSYYQMVENGIPYSLPADRQDKIYEKCVEYGIPDYYKLMIALAWHESTFRTHLISKTNDYGLFQINTCNHARLRRELGVTDFLDPVQNIDCGVYMMSELLKKYNFDVERALVGYNMGEGRAKTTHSTKYSRCVVSDMERLQTLN